MPHVFQLVNGDSPYGWRYAAEYPVSRQTPGISPAIVAMHAPLTLLPLRIAGFLYFAIMVLLVLLISAQSVSTAGHFGETGFFSDGKLISMSNMSKFLNFRR